MDKLEEVLIKTYGQKRDHREFPELIQVPLNDTGGYVTDTWDLEDRLIMLTVLLFEVKIVVRIKWSSIPAALCLFSQRSKG